MRILPTRAPTPLLRALPLALLLAPLFALGAAPGRAEEAARAPGPTEAERAEIRRLVDELRAEASRIRGLPWKREVPADLLSRDEMVAQLLAEMDEEYPPEERKRDDRILRRMGMLQEGEDVVELTLFLLREGVQGFFDPKDEKLFLIQGLPAEAQKPAILHELIHALEHQHYDLLARVKPYEDDDPDRVFAEKCLQEGAAEHGRAIFEKAHPEDARRFQEEQARTADFQGQLAMLERVPAYLILSVQMHYDLGPKLVSGYVGEDFAGGMARLYADPPTTQEQLLHREKWLGAKRDLDRRVVWGGDLAAAAGEGWKKLHELSLGELDLALYLDYHLSGRKGRVDVRRLSRNLWASPEATIAAEGWDAGRDVYLEKEGRPIAYVSGLAFDTPRDAVQARDALAKALKAVNPSFEPRPPDSEEADVLAWTSANGEGRMQVRGDEVLIADGFPADALERVWPALLATRFERRPGDAIPPPP